jgi:hypothetical protein
MRERLFDNRGGNLYNEAIVFTNLKMSQEESFIDIC